MEMWRIPSLINVEAAPINIFISAYAPCWKHIQRDFKLYELISYLLRQLSMPTPPLLPPNIFSSPSSPALISFPPFFSISPHCRNGIWAFGVHTAGNKSWVSVPLNRLVWGKFERTHSQPGDIQYDKKAGSHLITSCINTQRERRIAYAGWCNRNKKSCIPHLILQLCVIISLQFFYSAAQTNAHKYTHALSFSL